MNIRMIYYLVKLTPELSHRRSNFYRKYIDFNLPRPLSIISNDQEIPSYVIAIPHDVVEHFICRLKVDKIDFSYIQESTVHVNSVLSRNARISRNTKNGYFILSHRDRELLEPPK